MNLQLPGLEDDQANENDIVLTPDPVARRIVEYFRPQGRILDPCKGAGAFLRHMPGADWCEIREGRDFMLWSDPVDWIVSNPPYSTLRPFLLHSFEVARDVVYLIPINKLFASISLTRAIWAWGGVPTILVVDDGRKIGFPFGFPVGAVHFQRGYRGGTTVDFARPV